MDGSFISFLQPYVSCKLFIVLLPSHFLSSTHTLPKNTPNFKICRTFWILYSLATRKVFPNYHQTTDYFGLTNLFQFQTSHFLLPIPTNLSILPILPIVLYKLFYSIFKCQKTCNSSFINVAKLFNKF